MSKIEAPIENHFEGLLLKSDLSVDYSLMELPHYVDHVKIKRLLVKVFQAIKRKLLLFFLHFRVQKMFKRNYFAIMSAMYLGLLTILAIPSILNILIHTKKSSSPFTAYQRYMRTIFHVLIWFRHDIKVGSCSWKSILLVRKVHSTASDSSNAANRGMISQRDMAITQFGFMGFSVLFKNKLGINCTVEEMNDYCHFWRVLGHLFGIKDE